MTDILGKLKNVKDGDIVTITVIASGKGFNNPVPVSDGAIRPHLRFNRVSIPIDRIHDVVSVVTPPPPLKVGQVFRSVSKEYEARIVWADDKSILYDALSVNGKDTARDIKTPESFRTVYPNSTSS